MLTLDLNNALEQELNDLANQSGKTVAQLLKDVITEYLEDCHDAALGDAVMDARAKGDSITISFEEWERQLDNVEN